ncbi:bifunctional adenosylcobinamide kinase/adenosylcobinamide-phosphate guanylyltransferase [Pelagibaculum spongiae]|uniref:Bifunctional adenosylcobalamin biosynthesis protein n=1 Tax=Pelagibaculum spongiae TaxID=2080658 RepID=A0A2V1GVF1_9GAMM|nr:bifunctional adenosylcobinamide kinase/adenosylcobinamide-phosphate guanylyltransferase [Pelagibaculum spongiae]
MKQLFLGGARSGKSRMAEQAAIDSGLEVIYFATAECFNQDGEMAKRIERHRQQRPSQWQVIEEPIQLAEQLKNAAAENSCLLVDCLTLWLSNLLCKEDEALFQSEKQQLLALLEQDLPGHLILVSNEVGQGIIPMGELSRRYVDESGWLHQAVAARADKVIFSLAGLPQVLKDTSTITCCPTCGHQPATKNQLNKQELTK